MIFMRTDRYAKCNYDQQATSGCPYPYVHCDECPWCSFEGQDGNIYYAESVEFDEVSRSYVVKD
jgi:hypothetical protein